MWKLAEKYAHAIEEAAEKNKETKCVFIIADKQGKTDDNKWIKSFKKSNKWTLLRYYRRASHVFTQPLFRSGCSTERKRSIPTFEDILVC